MDFIVENANKEKSILLEADEIVNKKRQIEYGSPTKNFEDCAIMASILCDKKITAADVIKIQMCLKLAREANAHKRDNLIDLCGYAHILADKLRK